MSKIEYKNRYGYIFTFGKTEDGNILMEGSFKYMRIECSTTNLITMIDPSGGPYLNEDMNMGIFHESFEGMIIEQFKSVDEGYLIIVKKQDNE